MKTPAAKLPQLTAEMTRLQFHKFKTDWDVYIHHKPSRLSGTCPPLQELG